MIFGMWAGDENETGLAVIVIAQFSALGVLNNDGKSTGNGLAGLHVGAAIAVERMNF